MKINEMIEKTKRPLIFEKGTSQMWVDEYISQQMLEAHLDPNTDAASRKPNTIDASVKWIKEYICGNNFEQKILDLGCGPGLYTNRLAKLGFNSVTGVDFSSRSIEYAKYRASELDLSVNYVCQDYLTLEYTSSFDVVLLIYCDFGVFNEFERRELLNKIYNSLKPGGKIVFDVFTPNKYSNHANSRTWTSYKGSFWRPTSHLCLDSSYWYSEERVHLQQTIVLDDNEDIQVYNIWDQTYTIAEISSILGSIGFEDFEFYADVTGRKYEEETDVITIIASKK
ncbi:class I SAM-dependent methyltransferase [Paenibacillus wynnii]|uniref:class I SAM-dependent methyltransferase n=1 Tax=Paenibacillus wynnii TaxID=268407 RepID=UPI002791FADA|nr:class I SAM-dependent methyltransferase [Paenibacillus wynnii]MDQ0193273.1 2-polyprenyl-3-methyl-5-hydroxy-6-metoxy-1,4-benzoquinol methylase [Paenibacillus wynnii]